MRRFKRWLKTYLDFLWYGLREYKHGENYATVKRFFRSIARARSLLCLAFWAGCGCTNTLSLTSHSYRPSAQVRRGQTGLRGTQVDSMWPPTFDHLFVLELVSVPLHDRTVGKNFQT
jgi:hypothetical protein